MKLQCPHCHGFGVYKVKLRLWQRLMRMERLYYCYDCTKTTPRSELVEVD